MKRNQTLQSIRAADFVALRAMLFEARARLLELRVQHRITPIKNVRQIRHVRRSIAQMETILQGLTDTSKRAT